MFEMAELIGMESAQIQIPLVSLIFLSGYKAHKNLIYFYVNMYVYLSVTILCLLPLVTNIFIML